MTNDDVCEKFGLDKNKYKPTIIEGIIPIEFCETKIGENDTCTKIGDNDDGFSIFLIESKLDNSGW